MSENNPWKTVSTHIVYENPWIRVREDQVIRPDGNPGIYGVVETKIAVGVVALTPEREIYLVGQYRYATDCYSWEIVEGGTERGEDPLLAIKRELQEEAGLRARNWIPLGPTIHLSNCISNEIAMLYLATDLTETEKNPDATEVLKVQRKALPACMEMIRSGEITDAMTIMALYRLDELIRNGEL